MSQEISTTEAFLNVPVINKIAIGLFVLAKFCGIVGIGVSFAGYRTLGGVLLLLDGVLLLSCILCCIFQMGRQSKEDKKDQDTVEKMIQDGSIHEKLREAGYKIVLSK